MLRNMRALRHRDRQEECAFYFNVADDDDNERPGERKAFFFFTLRHDTLYVHMDGIK